MLCFGAQRFGGEHLAQPDPVEDVDPRRCERVFGVALDRIGIGGLFPERRDAALGIGGEDAETRGVGQRNGGRGDGRRGPVAAVMLEKRGKIDVGDMIAR